MFPEDGRTDTTVLTVAFRNFANTPKTMSTNCNKTLDDRNFIPYRGRDTFFFFITASRPHPADHSHLLLVKDFRVKYRKYFAYSLLQKTKQALMLRLLFQVVLSLQFHRTTFTLLEEVSHWG